MADMREQGTSFLTKLHDFAVEGNAVDLAIGAIVVTTFGAIVSSIVDDIFAPIVGLIIDGVDISSLFVVVSNLANASVPSLIAAADARATALDHSVFSNAMVSTAIAIIPFLVVKGINSMKKQIVAEATSSEAKSMPMAAPKAPSVKKPASKAATAGKAAVKKAPAKKKAAAKKAPAKKKTATKAAAAKKAPAKKAPAKKKAAAKKAPAKKKTAAKKSS